MLTRLVTRPLTRRLLSSASASAPPAPAICAVQLRPTPGKDAELASWLVEGRQLLERTLHAQRDKSSVPGSWIVGSEVRSCYHWVHVPSTSGEHPDTVAIV